MKYFSSSILLVLCLFLSATSHAFEIPPWSSSQKIYDSTGSLNKESRDSLTKTSTDLAKSSDIDMYFIMIDSIGKDSMSTYGKAILSDWGMESKSVALMILAKEDHRVRIELGDSAKSKLRLDDISAANKAAIQHFRVLDFEGGVKEGFFTLTKNVVRTEAVTPVVTTTKVATTENFFTSTPAIVGEGVLGGILIFFAWRFARKKKESSLQAKEQDWERTRRSVKEMKEEAEALVKASSIKSSGTQEDYLSKSLIDSAIKR